MSGWSVADIPAQTGRVAIVTGATGGLGYETALALAGKGAHVVLAGRDARKGEAAVAAIRKRASQAAIAFELLDLASLASVRRFADRVMQAHPALDILVNNAGVMAIPDRRETVDGFEMQFGTNYLGHFALSGLLLPVLKKGREPRVVDVSSLAHVRGRIDFADPQGRYAYGPWKAYGQSKLAMLLHAQEWQRRNAARGWGVVGVAAHPGWAFTRIFHNGPALAGGLGWKEKVAVALFPIFGQSAAAGALPILHAATAPRIQAGGYYGPDGIGELRGAPKLARVAPHGHDVDAAAKLWALSVYLTGVDPEQS